MVRVGDRVINGGHAVGPTSPRHRGAGRSGEAKGDQAEISPRTTVGKSKNYQVGSRNLFLPPPPLSRYILLLVLFKFKGFVGRNESGT